MKRSKETPNILHKARASEQSGNLAEAASLYAKVLTKQATHRGALERLGLIEIRNGECGRAEALFSRLVTLAPDEPRYHLYLGDARQRLDRHNEALQDYWRALTLKPDCSEALLRVTGILQRLGEVEVAITWYESVLELKFDSVQLQLGYSRALWAQGDTERADIHERCAAYLRGTRDLGVTCETLQYDARAYRDAGQRGLAMAYYHAWLAMLPGSSELWIEFSDFLRNLGKSMGALQAARRATLISPDSARAQAALAAALADNWQLGEALAAARRANAIDPALADAHFQLGRTFFGMGELEPAVAGFRTAIELDENHRAAHSALIFAMQYVPGYSQNAMVTEARRWAKCHTVALSTNTSLHSNDRTRNRRLRLGYVSEDFRSHPMANFVLPLFEYHDRKDVEVYCYSSVRQPDAITQCVRESSDVFRDLLGISDRAAVEVIRNDQIDVLVDLALHSGDHRLRTFALRPAPVQVSYLGYLGTTGLDAVQYRITAPYIDAPDSDIEDRSSEALLTLPRAYWCYSPLEDESDSDLQPASEPPAIVAGVITFGSQNSCHKVSDETILVWAKVLHAQPRSRLVMHAPVEARPRLSAAFDRTGLEMNRLTFLDRRSRREYLKTYRNVDLCLDTVPYSGATTSLDAFWMGTPTLTLVGRTPASRGGLHICMNLDLAALVAHTSEEFVAKAVELTNNLDQLVAVRKDLRQRLQNSSLMDAPRHVADLEALYRKAWHSWCED